MNLEGLIFAIGMFGFLLSLILYVVFGQTTVRKLRNNPKTKNDLGVQFASGWDILNVAQALALPNYITRKLGKSPISNFFAISFPNGLFFFNFFNPTAYTSR